MTFSIMTPSITTFRIMTLTIKGLFATFSVMAFSISDTQHNSTSTIVSTVIMSFVIYVALL
jgi:hypothetical protein